MNRSSIGKRAAELRTALGESARGMDSIGGVANRWGRMESWDGATVAAMSARARRASRELLDVIAAKVAASQKEAQAVVDYVLDGVGGLPAVRAPSRSAAPPRIDVDTFLATLSGLFDQVRRGALTTDRAIKAASQALAGAAAGVVLSPGIWEMLRGF